MKVSVPEQVLPAGFIAIKHNGCVYHGGALAPARCCTAYAWYAKKNKRFLYPRRSLSELNGPHELEWDTMHDGALYEIKELI